MITGYSSLKELMAKLYRDLAITDDISEYVVAEWVGEVLEKIGTYYQYKETKTCLELTNGRTRVPINFHRLKDIAFNNKPLRWASPDMYTDYSCEGCVIPSCCTDYSFYISDNYIVTDIPADTVNGDGNESICIVYLSIPTDTEGYPLIPDDVYFKEACAKYVTYKLDYREWRKGNIPDKVMQKSESDYLFYVGSAKGSANMPGQHQLQRILDSWVRLIPKHDENSSFFPHNKERRYLK
jgi:hypothetical protein